MVQSNSCFNFFNTKTTSYIKDNIKIQFLQLNNTKFILFFNSKVYDNFNNYVSSYKLKKKTSKILSLYYFYNFFLIQWCHISCKGKSYRIKPFRRYNRFTLNFGYSHWTKLSFKKLWKFRRKRRQKYFIWTLKFKSLLNFKRFFPYIRVMNRYTLRGLRLTKQPIKRRFGKISQHISSLH